MLSTLGEEKAADAVEKAVMFITANKIKSLQAGKMGYSTSQVGDLVAEKVSG
jgi:3-isopropylmalate dehydrogenase